MGARTIGAQSPEISGLQWKKSTWIDHMEICVGGTTYNQIPLDSFVQHQPEEVTIRNKKRYNSIENQLG
jgi:hypothetical protein